MLVLGIDPGSVVTGFGIVRIENKSCQYVTSGCIRVKKETTAERLHEIFDGICQIVEAYKPDQAAIEQIFFFQNPQSAIKLGQARGTALVALAHHQLAISEYSAKQVKQAVVGVGNAAKNQVQHMVQNFLNLSAKPQADAADALAVAICHYHTAQSLGHIQGASKTVRGRLRR
ncbi:crossover junction endodeoxyribonuclease RuvC [Thiotrichales bacterium 19S11-10]|nr:crossover junction endodeoxyribonuclease RuvC [Thiotrichales bacterium 19S11-10]MCF6807212.1 crossover junction endodeoxyribonuclease RuvC [Thiotrichales bacterium 19S9-11]MCF6811181.1 crossover junction endodeoxyribonuclease RuvC [Thiotrichales bacterium 19S9-12]